MRTYVRYEKCVFENAVLLLMLVEYKLAKIGIASEKYDWIVRDVDGGFKDNFILSTTTLVCIYCIYV